MIDVRVVLVDDHAILREGLRMVLEAQPGITVLGEAADGREAVQLVEQLHPGIAVMDIAMPHLNGIEATRQIKRRFPLTSIVILTMRENWQYLAQILDAGAIGAVLKRSAGTELVMAVRAAVRGESYFSPPLATMMVEDYRLHQLREGYDPTEHLTEREREVLQLVVEGKTNQEIARELVLSIKTVQTHRAHLMQKLDSHDRTDLVRYAIEHGVIAA